MPIESSALYLQLSQAAEKYNSLSLPADARNTFEKDLLLHLSWNTIFLAGNTLSPPETIAILTGDEEPDFHPYEEYTEAKKAFRALRVLLSFRASQVIDLDYIQAANALFLGSDGSFRNYFVYLGMPGESTVNPPAPDDIAHLMAEYTSSISSCSSSLLPEQAVSCAARLHLDFERIHPFPDGNGRTGRLFLDQFLLNQGLLPAIMENKDEYRQAFRDYDRAGSTAAMEDCIANGILRSYEIFFADFDEWLS